MSTQAAASPRPSLRWALHVGLLLLTFVFTAEAGLAMAREGGLVGPSATRAGLGFALAMLAILLSHEMGHYVFARIHRVDTTLPYVIPVPSVIPGVGLISYGTLGAVIRMRSPISTRDALVDIGAAGPIAGAIMALPLLALGISWSPAVPSPVASESFWFGHQTLWNFGLDAFRHLRAAMLHLPIVAVPAGKDGSLGDNLLIRLMVWFIHGSLPAGQTLQLHPVAVAAWFGLLVTSLNLFPLGQLDGGHVSYAVFGERAHLWMGRAVSWCTLLMAFFCCYTWLVWWLVTRWAIGFGHPPVRDGSQPLGKLRLAIAVISVLLLFLTFIPVPMDHF